jgi:Flp pilus assembly protein TadD
MSERAAVSYDFAYQHYQRGDLIQALGAAMRAVELSPTNAEARNLLGLIYFAQGKSVEAEAAFIEAARLDPKMTEAWNNLGTLYLSSNRLAEAEKALWRATENPLYLYPERIQNNLGLVYQAQGKKDEAARLFQEAVRLNPRFYLPYQNLGRLSIEQGNLAQAERHLQEASRLCSDCAEPRYHLGRALMQMNRQKEAVESFRLGAQLDPDGYFGQLCRQYIVSERKTQD